MRHVDGADLPVPLLRTALRHDGQHVQRTGRALGRVLRAVEQNRPVWALPWPSPGHVVVVVGVRCRPGGSRGAGRRRRPPPRAARRPRSAESFHHLRPGAGPACVRCSCPARRLSTPPRSSAVSCFGCSRSCPGPHRWKRVVVNRPLLTERDGHLRRPKACGLQRG